MPALSRVLGDLDTALTLAKDDIGRAINRCVEVHGGKLPHLVEDRGLRIGDLTITVLVQLHDPTPSYIAGACMYTP